MIWVGCLAGTYISLFYLVGLKLTLISSPLFGCTDFIDIWIRTSVNDSYLGSYNVFWTSFTYLPGFVWLMFWFTSIGFLSAGRACVLVFCFLIYRIYLSECLDLLIANSVLWDYSPLMVGVNPLLLNPMNRYHPYVFYTSVMFLLCGAVWVLLGHWGGPRFSLIGSVGRYRDLARRVLWWNLVALLMGSWWALQEGTWGGWWNWDASEVLGMGVSLSALLTYHTVTRWEDVRLLMGRSLSSVLLVVASYYFLQLNFDLVSHNFGASFFYFFSNSLWFSQGAFMGLAGIGGMCVALYRASYRFVLGGDLARGVSFSHIHLSVTRFFVLIVFLIMVVFSYAPLAIYFLWTFAGLSFGELNTHYDLLVVSFLFILTYMSSVGGLWSASYTSLGVLSTTPFGWFLLKLPVAWTRFTVIHTLLLSLVALNCSYYITSYSLWVLVTVGAGWFTESSFIIPWYSAYCVDGGWVEFRDLAFQPISGFVSAWNLLHSANTPTLTCFWLLCDGSQWVNFYVLLSSLESVYVFIDLPYHSWLLVLSLLVVSMV